MDALYEDRGKGALRGCVCCWVCLATPRGFGCTSELAQTCSVVGGWLVVVVLAPKHDDDGRRPTANNHQRQHHHDHQNSDTGLPSAHLHQPRRIGSRSRLCFFFWHLRDILQGRLWLSEVPQPVMAPILRPRQSLSAERFSPYFSHLRPQLYNDPNGSRSGSNKLRYFYSPSTLIL